MRRTVQRFWEDETASFTVEMVMVLPILLWGYFGMFTLFEGFRSLNANVNAAYTISDLLSRQTEAVDLSFIQGLNQIQDIITQSPHETILRVTVVEFKDQGTTDTSDDQHLLKWSQSTAVGDVDLDGLTQAETEAQIVPHLPTMYNGEQLIVVETWMAFVPFFNITLSTLVDEERSNVFQAFYFEGIAVTRPRFSTQLCWLTCAATTT